MSSITFNSPVPEHTILAPVQRRVDLGSVLHVTVTPDTYNEFGSKIPLVPESLQGSPLLMSMFNLGKLYHYHVVTDDDTFDFLAYEKNGSRKRPC